MNTGTKSNIYLFIGSLCLILIVSEVMLNFFVDSSDRSSGNLFGRQLPPLAIIPPDKFEQSGRRGSLRSQWYEGLVVDGKKITRGDLFGIKIEHELLGHTIKPNSVSENGWFQSNNLGARSRKATSRKIPAGKRRLLFFGNSFTQGSRLPQESTFVSRLEGADQGIEAVNFGVDGYGMGQAYLRYTLVRDELEYDEVFLVFVPSADLSRDINVQRSLMGWNAYKINPRYILGDTGLVLVTSPYVDYRNMLDRNRMGIEPKLREHLANYDSFYSGLLYEATPVPDVSIIFRLSKLAVANLQTRILRERVMNPESEAMQVTRAIIDSMANDVRDRNGKFTLIPLPIQRDIERYSADSSYRDRWTDMYQALCSGSVACVDFMPDFIDLPSDRIDSGYDGSHYGPLMNSLIAALLCRSVCERTLN